MRRVFITGMGIGMGSGLGENPKETFGKACFEGRRLIGKAASFDTSGLSTPFFGEGKDLPGEGERLNARFLALLEGAFRDLLEDTGLAPEEIASWGTRCRVFFGTLIFGSEGFYRHSKARRRGKRDSFIAHVNDYSRVLKEISGVTGSVTVISSSCASGTTAAGMGMHFIREGICDAAIVGGADSLSIVTAYGFNALKSLSGGVANPFDEARDGINIGECGAYFLLESEEHAKARRARILGEAAGYGLGNDAYHITSPHPEGEGAYRVMEAALSDAGIGPEAVGYVNAHGTGTVINDSMESKALARLFEGVSHPVYVSSAKALIGHAMGASGAMELASTVLALNERRYIPMPGLKAPLLPPPLFHLSPEPSPMEAEYALKNSFAFGGNGAAVVLRRGSGSKEFLSENAADRGKAVADIRIKGIGILSPVAKNAGELSAFAGKLLRSSLRTAQEQNEAHPPLSFDTGVSSSKVRRAPRFVKMAVAAAHLAWQDGGTPAVGSGAEVGTILSTGYGPVESNVIFADSVADGVPSLASPAVFSYTVPNSCLGQVCIAHGFQGPSTMLMGGDFLEYASLLLSGKKARYMLCGGVEEASEPLKDSFAADGLSLGLADGAGMFLLARGEDAAAYYARLTKFASASLPACPYTAVLDEAERRESAKAVAAVLQQVAEEPPALVLTAANGSYFDEVEAAALAEVWRAAARRIAPKAFFGETLGAGYGQSAALAAAMARTAREEGLPLSGGIVAAGIDIHGNYLAARIEV